MSDLDIIIYIFIMQQRNIMKLKILLIFSLSIIYAFASFERGYTTHKKSISATEPISTKKTVKKHKLKKRRSKKKVFHKRKPYKKKKTTIKKTTIKKVILKKNTKHNKTIVNKKIKIPQMIETPKENYTSDIDRMLEETKNMQKNLEHTQTLKYY
jgi:hypothetical protein